MGVQGRAVSAGSCWVASGLFPPFSGPAQEAGRGTQELGLGHVRSDFQIGWILETTSITSGCVVGAGPQSAGARFVEDVGTMGSSEGVRLLSRMSVFPDFTGRQAGGCHRHDDGQDAKAGTG